jgi:hypothetical protein
MGGLQSRRYPFLRAFSVAEVRSRDASFEDSAVPKYALQHPFERLPLAFSGANNDCHSGTVSQFGANAQSAAGGRQRDCRRFCVSWDRLICQSEKYRENPS